MKLRRLIVMCAASLMATAMMARQGKTYYVDARQGSDGASGLSPRSAWRSLAKASSLRLKAGDRLLLRRGGVFEGQLEIVAQGTAEAPVFVGGYGTGRLPRIVGLDRSPYAVRVYNSSHVTLRGLEIVNTGRERMPGRTGLKVEAADYGVSRHILIDSLTIRDVNGSLVKEQGGGSAILIANGGRRVPSRYDRLTIQNCHIVNCARNAMIWSSGYYDRRRFLPSTHTTVRGNLIEKVPGDGIVPIGCDSTLIEYNVMRDCPDILPDTEAAAGIWPWSCDNTVIQYNEVSDHKAPWDAQGYDCDYNCRNTLIQYNYSHDNYGGLVLICDDGAERNYSIGNEHSTVRYNISIGDGVRPKKTRTGGYFSPSIHIAGRVTDALVEHNIIHSNAKPSAATDRTMIASDSWGGYADRTTIRRNVFYTAEQSRFEMNQSTNNVFSGNVYLGSYQALPADREAKTTSHTYQSEVVNRDPAGYRALEGLMRRRTLYGVTCFAIDKEAIETFFSTLK